jgi:hypothetical protein
MSLAKKIKLVNVIPDFSGIFMWSTGKIHLGVKKF